MLLCSNHAPDKASSHGGTSNVGSVDHFLFFRDRWWEREFLVASLKEFLPRRSGRVPILIACTRAGAHTRDIPRYKGYVSMPGVLRHTCLLSCFASPAYGFLQSCMRTRQRSVSRYALQRSVPDLCARCPRQPEVLAHKLMIRTLTCACAVRKVWHSHRLWSSTYHYHPICHCLVRQQVAEPKI